MAFSSDFPGLSLWFSLKPPLTGFLASLSGSWLVGLAWVVEWGQIDRHLLMGLILLFRVEDEMKHFFNLIENLQTRRNRTEAGFLRVVGNIPITVAERVGGFADQSGKSRCRKLSNDLLFPVLSRLQGSEQSCMGCVGQLMEENGFLWSGKRYLAPCL
jgi:hypothetical protein